MQTYAHSQPLRRLVLPFPQTQGSYNSDCSHLWFHDGGNNHQMLSNQNHSLQESLEDLSLMKTVLRTALTLKMPNLNLLALTFLRL